ISNQAIDNKETRTEKSILITLWIKNAHKVISYMLGYNDVTLDPKNFEIFFKQNLVNWVNIAIRTFFGTPKKQSKYSLVSKDQAEVHIEKITIKPDISQETVQAAVVMSSNLHKNITEVREVVTSLNKQFTVFLFVDMEGRKILTKSHEFFTLASSIAFINKQFFQIQKDVVIYAMTEEELKKEMESIYEIMQTSVKEHQKVRFLETGWYPIFMNTDATHTLFHEGIAGHLLSGRYIVEEDSKVFEVMEKDFSKEKRFAILKKLTVENKPNLPGTIATYTFDHEGIRAKDITLMEKGKVVNYLTNRNSAKRLNKKESNGTALASSFVVNTVQGPIIVQPEPRISNLIITSHSKKTEQQLREDLIKQCKKQKMEFYLEIWSKAGQVNVEDGVFNLEITECDMVYLDGRREKIWGGLLSGNLFEFIGAIKDISQETESDNGMCGSESGWVPTHGEAPYMTLKTFQFIATKKPEKVNMQFNQKHVPEE
ncbi:MAG: metallopeptidase TldD-related protein, partial [candidate division SR1 bacterium]|nr:metallopeptidase TldD-related protein [candidate division SR1 bacterium]